MRPRPDDDDISLDFRRKATFGLAILSLLLLTPFAFNNFLQGRPLLGTGSLVIVLILAWNAWETGRQRYSAWPILLGLVPMIIVFLVLSLRRQGIIGALWCYPAVLAFYMMLPERKAWIANAALFAIAVPQAWMVLPQGLAVRIAASLLGVSGFSILFVRAITEQQRRLETLARTDPLTGLFNRKTLRVSLDSAIAEQARGGVPMTLAAIDIDDFKSVNDLLGHDAGDEVLRGVAGLLRRHVRAGDRVFRTGGEEFLVLLHGADAAQAAAIAEQLRQLCASQPLLADRRVTASIGLATLHPGETRADWMKRADKNLYRAKDAGRNRVVA